MGKKRVCIEQLLSWAYLEELPKQNEGGGLLSDLAMLGAPIDKGHIGDRMPLGAGPPHPDAILLHYHVCQLPYVRVDWARQRDYLMGPLAPWLDLNDITVSAMATGLHGKRQLDQGIKFRAFPRGRRGKKKLRASAEVDKDARLIEAHHESAAGLVMMHARLKTRPIWQVGDITVRPVIGGNNQPMMIGRSTRRGYYTEGSHCPLTLSPPPQEIASARFEYMVWHQALCELAMCGRELRDHEPLLPSAPAQPWVTGEEPKRPVHDAERAVRYPTLPLHPQRDRARVLPPLRTVTTDRGRSVLHSLTKPDNAA